MVKKLRSIPTPALAKAKWWFRPYFNIRRLAVIMVGMADSSTETL